MSKSKRKKSFWWAVAIAFCGILALVFVVVAWWLVFTARDGYCGKDLRSSEF